MVKETQTDGAFATDKLYGTRLDQAFQEGEHFLLLAGKIGPEKIETEIGPADQAQLLVQKVDTDGAPTGRAFQVNSLAKPVVDKVKALTADDLPATVCWLKIYSKKFKTDATVLQYVAAGESPDELLAAFGVDKSDLDSKLDSFRKPGERIPL